MGLRGPKPRTREQVIAVVLSKLDTSGGPDACHEYGGSRHPYGYGMVQARGLSSVPLTVHVLIYEHFNGPVPEGMEVRHTCDNPPCGNRRHLIIGTHRQNMHDAMERGRFKIGGDHRRFRKED